MLDSWPCPSLPEPPSPQLKASPVSEEIIDNNQHETKLQLLLVTDLKMKQISHNSQLKKRIE